MSGRSFLKQLSEFTWEIVPDYKSGMRVPVRVFASKKLIESMDEGVFEQISNVATLPGIQKYAIALPDAHRGYGFCIGAVAAFDPKNGGVISPGGIGFDINCLSGGTRVLHEHGYSVPLAELEGTSDKVICWDANNFETRGANVAMFLSKRANPGILEIRTEGGHQIEATPDHPLLTPEGMKGAGALSDGDKVAVSPFEGVPYAEPQDEIILEEEDLAFLDDLSCSREQIIKELRKRNLLPLSFGSAAIPYLIKVLAYNMGDGSLVFTPKTHCAWFWGEEGDLEKIRGDVKKIGYEPSRIYKRDREHRIDTKYGKVEFGFTELSFKVGARSFIALLHALGAPLGRKANQDYGVPDWIKRAPLWQRRLFLASYFGAELSAPSTMKEHGYNFYLPTVSVNKTLRCLESGKEFLEDLRELLWEFGIRTAEISKVDKHTGRGGGVTQRLRLQILGTPENLIRLFGRVGFEFNRRKRFLGNAAVQYLRLRQRVLERRRQAEKHAQELYQSGKPAQQVFEKLTSRFINRRFLQRSLWGNRKTGVRVAYNFPTFEEYLEKAASGLGESGMVWDRIVELEKRESGELVYDLMIDHKSHNFVANNFVVSNCGLRLIRTNLKIEDLEPKKKELVDRLYERVPAGLGKKGFIKLDREEFKNLLRGGAEWCVKKGFGWEEDLERIEDGGKLAWADPSKVSEKAINRGVNQVGTLGSGNHFLELQRVSEIFDSEIAKKFGIEEVGQVTVMIHTGSRGFGHQIGTDYLRKFGEVMRKYGITVSDRELACAPFDSPEGKDYFGAMACGANSAFANRQVIMHRAREVFAAVFGTRPGRAAEDLGMQVVYDVAHNVAKVENGLVVHRKGATRAWGPENPGLSGIFQETGQPVIIGGSMQARSYLLVGTKLAEEIAFGSTAHGSGRLMSRTQAKRMVWGGDLLKKMHREGIYIKAASLPGLAEEAGIAYKDISEVVRVLDETGISKKVAEMEPVGNIKG